MRSRSNGGIIGAYQLPTQNFANGVFFIHDAAIYNTGNNPIWPLGTGFIYSASGGVISTAANDTNYKLHTFTANGTFTVSSGSGYIEVLVVGGGGAGGAANNATYGRGGGGAGGQVLLMEQVLVNGPTTFTVEVGAGGTATNITIGNTTTASLPGKPSRVTSNLGHSFISYGGGSGVSTYEGSLYGNGTNSYSGGGQATNSNRTANSLYAVTSSRTSYGSGSPGTSTVIVAPSGGGSYTLGNGAAAAGGGAGAVENGFDPIYGFDPTRRSGGGDGYQWARTGYWYGGGGPGGITYGYPFAQGIYAKFGLCGQSSTRLTNTGWSYSNSNLSSDEDGSSGVNNFGGGGGGGAIWSSTGNSGSNGAKGGAGGAGTIIFCYRYR